MNVSRRCICFLYHVAILILTGHKAADWWPKDRPTAEASEADLGNPRPPPPRHQHHHHRRGRRGRRRHHLCIPLSMVAFLSSCLSFSSFNSWLLFESISIRPWNWSVWIVEVIHVASMKESFRHKVWASNYLFIIIFFLRKMMILKGPPLPSKRSCVKTHPRWRTHFLMLET